VAALPGGNKAVPRAGLEVLKDDCPSFCFINNNVTLVQLGEENQIQTKLTMNVMLNQAARIVAQLSLMFNA